MNISILINIHHVDLALEFAERIIGIRDGHIVYDGPVKDITDKVLDSIYSGAPIPKVADQCDTDAKMTVIDKTQEKRAEKGKMEVLP